MARLQFILLAFLMAGCLMPQEGVIVPEDAVSNVTEPALNITPPENATEHIANISVSEPTQEPPPDSFIVGNQTPDAPINYSLSRLERIIFESINAERASNGLPSLAWNDDLAYAARLHSLSLANENIPLTDLPLFCKRPFIHHEGFDHGLYAIDRLYNRSIYYFAVEGENIFVISTWEKAMTYDEPEACPQEDASRIDDYGNPEDVERIKASYQERLDYMVNASRVRWAKIFWLTEDNITSVVTQGWLNSPGHRANILDPGFDEAGVGIARVNDHLIITQEFIKRVDCGYKDVSCCAENRTLYCYKPWYCQKGICG